MGLLSQLNYRPRHPLLYRRLEVEGRHKDLMDAMVLRNRTKGNEKEQGDDTLNKNLGKVPLYSQR